MTPSATKSPATPSSVNSSPSWERATTLPEAVAAFGQKKLAFHISRETAVTGVVLAVTPQVIVLRLAKTKQVVVLNPQHIIMVRESLA